MKKKNYQPWGVKIEEFPREGSIEEQLKFLLGFAILAPSSHNSQPWSFRIENSSIIIFPELKRRLLKSDANDRQLYISLGCAITNILIAADYYGYKTEIEYLSAGSAAKLLFSDSKAENKNDHLIFSIVTRTTNRNFYENRLPSDRFFDDILKTVDPDIQIRLITEKNVKDKIAHIVLDAGVAAMDNDDFRYELSRYVKHNLTRERLGMPAFGMGIPTPISFLAPAIIKKFNMNRLLRKKDEKLLKEGTPLFVILSTRNDGKKDWMKAGQLYEKISLLAERSGIKTAIWAAPIQIGNYYKSLQKLIDSNFRPQIFFRMGYTDKRTPHSPRLSVANVLLE